MSATPFSVSPANCGSAASPIAANTGNYRQALAIEDADPSLDINTVMASIRHDNVKYAFYLNGEQQLVKDVGLFGRGWNDGQTEILSFTDIDRSLSGGLSIKGSFWRRPSDTAGIGGAINGLSDAHRDFLAAGGLGLLIGDGQLKLALGADPGDLLRLFGEQEFYGHGGLSTHHKSRL